MAQDDRPTADRPYLIWIAVAVSVLVLLVGYFVATDIASRAEAAKAKEHERKAEFDRTIRDARKRTREVQAEMERFSKEEARKTQEINDRAEATRLEAERLKR